MSSLSSIKDFKDLIGYLEDELDWPLQEYGFDELTFEYQSEDLGLKEEEVAKIHAIHQMRPLKHGQPWGIFFVEFEKKKLPVVVLRRILSHLVIKKRSSANKAKEAAWHSEDLLFITAFGKEGGSDREIAFAHFHVSEDDLPTLYVLGWDGDNTVLHIKDAQRTLKEKLNWPDDERNVADWRKRWSSAFTIRNREVITTSKELAVRLADLAQSIRKKVNTIIGVESSKGALKTLHKAFKEALIHDLSEDDFADMYAQTIAYGLLAARISRPAGLVADNIADMAPVTNPFLKELLETFLTIGGRKGKIDFDELGISEVVEMLRDANMEAVLRDFGDRNPQEDPVIHFYELFLKEYDPEKKAKRGVFYTPRPVVSFIVRSVDDILRRDFGLEDGLADITTWGEMEAKNPEINIPKGVSKDEPFVQILDPATGTGTFLVEVIDLIHKTMELNWQKQGKSQKEIENLWNEYVPNHLLRRLYGFELMMAPYAIAHMKIGLKLSETGYHFGSEERARVYLTNTLEEPHDFSGQFESMAPMLAHEAEAANIAKRSIPVTVIIGNPPYSNFGKLNQSPWIINLINDYKTGLNETKINLDDDYIKFIRASQWYLDRAGTGILGYISNNSYLDGLTHRRMRGCLLTSFQNVSIVDLHGNVSAKEKAVDGTSDENVFDIQQGVCIGIFSKNHVIQNCLKHVSVKGTRSLKYDLLTNSDNQIAEMEAELLISHQQPWHFFVPKDFSLSKEYETYFTLKDIFAEPSYGIQTKRDAVTIAFDKRELESVVSDFLNLPESKIRDKYLLPADGRDWSIKWAKQDLKESTNIRKQTKQELYRPFDIRWTFYSSKSKGFLAYPRFTTMQHMLQKNLGLIAMRQVFQEIKEYTHFGVTNLLIDERTFYSNRGGTYLFPLYKYPENSLFRNANNYKELNFTEYILKQTDVRLGLKLTVGRGDFTSTIGAEDFFSYMYGVFYSRIFRVRYADLLKIDFPRLPLTSNLSLLKKLSSLGDELIGLHLLESSTLSKSITKFHDGSRALTKIGETGKKLSDVQDGKGRLYINSTSYFDKVPLEVWEFHIGGYQVCHKWLDDRRKAGRNLSDEDIEHYQKIIVTISETIRIMGEIDEVIEEHGGWPGAFLTTSSAVVPEDNNEPDQDEQAESFALTPEILVGQLPGLNVESANERTRPIQEIEREEIMVAIRALFSNGTSQMERGEAIKELSKYLDFQRTGDVIKQELDNHIRTAVKRGILENDNGTLKLLCRSVEGLNRDFLKEQFLASIGRNYIERDDATRAFARWFGFARTGSTIEDTTKSLINGLLRENRLNAEGSLIRRAT